MLLLALAVADSSHLAVERPRVAISAVCGGGTPEAYGVGAMVRDDGAVFRIEHGSSALGRKVARDVPFAKRMRDTLEKHGFERIERDAGSGPWCGLTRTVDSSSHTVRWATRVESSGSLAHLFEGVPVELWHVFLQLQQVGVEQELCRNSSEDRLPREALRGAIWMSCGATGLIPKAAGVYVLADGDVITWTGPLVSCSRVVGSDVDSLSRWHATLSGARFDNLRDRLGATQYGDADCSVGRWLHAQPHEVRLRIDRSGKRQVPDGSQWKVVERVLTELGAKFPLDDERLVPALRRAMTD